MALLVALFKSGISTSMAAMAITIAIVAMTRLSTRNWVNSCIWPAPIVLRMPTSRLRPSDCAVARFV